MMTDNKSNIKKVKEQVESILQLLNEFHLEKRSEQQASDVVYPGELPHRVIHLRNNPIEKKMRAEQSEFELAISENTRLKARLALLETGNKADVTRRIDDAVSNANQIELLKNKITEFKQREDKIMHTLRKTSREFRQAVYLLTGYKVFPRPNRIYKLSHMYAESKDDMITFQISTDGRLQLLRDEYSNRFAEYIATYLTNGDSVPAFLAAITLNLFELSKRPTDDMSLVMSTTIQPSNYENRGGFYGGRF